MFLNRLGFLVTALAVMLLAPVAAAETLTITVVGQGTTSPGEGAHTYDNGATVFLSATANHGWRFDRWEGDLTGTNPFLQQIVMDSDKNVTAVFVETVMYTLTVNVVGDGSVQPYQGTTSLVGGTLVTLDAVPAAGAAFDR